jgi:hypothetical protein
MSDVGPVQRGSPACAPRVGLLAQARVVLLQLGCGTHAPVVVVHYIADSLASQRYEDLSIHSLDIISKLPNSSMITSIYLYLYVVVVVVVLTLI